MLLICLAAQVTATLQALGQFTVPALTPTVLNLCWLTGVWVIAPYWAPKHQAQAYVVAVDHPRGRGAPVGRATAGPVSLRLPLSIQLGGQPPAMLRIGRTITPMLFSLAVTQINTFTDSMIAWGLAAPPGGPRDSLAWRGRPLSAPARVAAAIYVGERLYQFPLGIVGWPWPLRSSPCSAGTPPAAAAAASAPTMGFGSGWCCV